LAQEAVASASEIAPEKKRRVRRTKAEIQEALAKEAAAPSESEPVKKRRVRRTKAEIQEALAKEAAASSNNAIGMRRFGKDHKPLPQDELLTVLKAELQEGAKAKPQAEPLVQDADASASKTGPIKARRGRKTLAMKIAEANADDNSPVAGPVSLIFIRRTAPEPDKDSSNNPLSGEDPAQKKRALNPLQNPREIPDGGFKEDGYTQGGSSQTLENAIDDSSAMDRDGILSVPMDPREELKQNSEDLEEPLAGISTSKPPPLLIKTTLAKPEDGSKATEIKGVWDDFPSPPEENAEPATQEKADSYLNHYGKHGDGLPKFRWSEGRVNFDEITSAQVKRMRILAGFSVKDFCDRLGIRVTTYNVWEKTKGVLTLTNISRSKLYVFFHRFFF
jgi:hypothetical protein